MPRPCAAVHPDPRPDICRVCMWSLDPGPTGQTYRRLWGMSAAAGRAMPCSRLGLPTGDWRECRSCGGAAAVYPVYHCDKHAECVIGKSFADVRNCADCGDYQPEPERR